MAELSRNAVECQRIVDLHEADKAQPDEATIKAIMDQRIRRHLARVLTCVAGLLLFAAPAFAQTVELPLTPATVRLVWADGADNGANTEEYLLSVDGARFSLGRPSPIPTGGYSLQAPAAVLSAFTAGTHQIRMVVKNSTAEALGPITIVDVKPAPVVTPGKPLPLPPGPVTVIVITITGSH